jgi:hypothetical protein
VVRGRRRWALGGRGQPNGGQRRQRQDDHQRAIGEEQQKIDETPGHARASSKRRAGSLRAASING